MPCCSPRMPWRRARFPQPPPWWPYIRPWAGAGKSSPRRNFKARSGAWTETSPSKGLECKGDIKFGTKKNNDPMGKPNGKADIPVFNNTNDLHEAVGFAHRSHIPNFDVFSVEDLEPFTRRCMPPYRQAFYQIGLLTFTGNSR